MDNRQYDVILWGATGFTGRLVAEYLNKQYGASSDLKWAMAGRNKEKLATIRKEIGNGEIPLIVADSKDRTSLDKMVQQAKVICTTVGPYAKYGSELVASCVENGVDYCDLTGETQWIRRMIDQHHEAAKANGVKIVHCCGFDSVPSDIGVHFLQKEAKAQKGEYCNHIKLRVKVMKGGMSGGTYASLNNLMAEAADDPSIMTILQNPYGLNPIGEQNWKDVPDITEVLFDEDMDAYISPFVMAGINTRVVRRSHALQGYPYGKDFRYEEATLVGSSFSKRFTARLTNSVVSKVMTGGPDSFLKRMADRYLPKPGEGPTKEQREEGFFNLILLGKFANGDTISAKVKGDRDPGYGSTSKMLGEAAVCLAKDELSDVSGVITPAVAMGDALLERLIANSGLSFGIES